MKINEIYRIHIHQMYFYDAMNHLHHVMNRTAVVIISSVIA